MGSLAFKSKARIKRKKTIRKTLVGTTQRPRLSVFRSAKHIYAQVIDDTCGRTIAAASTVEKDVKENFAQTLNNSLDLNKGKIIAAVYIGKLVAERAAEKGVKQVVFDRNGFLYHGRVKAVSDGARKAGLVF
ncbi:MAG: 50S ribosomal protein L18 [Deltaproteobacteria bacterium]|nr:50S ribosomal protein L18 [Deltaproteobacteria bacterium]MBW2660982.1 50S ribosomal protein L18 [Deltaproteobacteria bacterium]